MPTELHDPLEVVADALTEKIQNEPSVVEKEDGEEKNESEAEAEFAETSDAEADAGDRGNSRHNGDAPHDGHLTNNVSSIDIVDDTDEYLVISNHYNGFMNHLNRQTKPGDWFLPFLISVVYDQFLSRARRPISRYVGQSVRPAFDFFII